MKHLFVSKEISSKLYKLGFEEYCMGGYYDGIFEYSSGFIRNTTFADENNVTAPLYQQVFDWIREKYKFQIQIDTSWRDDDKLNGYGYIGYSLETGNYGLSCMGFFKNYYDAVESAINKYLDFKIAEL